jgi:hypothetical protein
LNLNFNFVRMLSLHSVSWCEKMLEALGLVILVK